MSEVTEKKKKNEFWEWSKALVIAILLAAVIRYFLFAPIVVDGESMMPTLHDQDRMIVNKIGYNLGKPKRFDIIVFHAPENKDYIKRIIGLPGDRIEYKDDTLYVNGKAYEEPYLDKYKQEFFDGPLTQPFKLEDTAVGSETVPEGHLFVMGDNRRYSKDSRHIGAVSMEKVLGETNMVYWPVEDLRLVE
ncbi:signal peptidase I [Peribacillus saganii]|uniref:Signal peptidase I n=1 Tax=Peribacillus saganii TaxID=2303992 RepID=A0A372LT75_9BACI|nr:signal peptidase I [Peribacillus saganii]RFU71266.1 signal peptidase I [Peribacillus saganii]